MNFNVFINPFYQKYFGVDSVLTKKVRSSLYFSFIPGVWDVAGISQLERVSLWAGPISAAAWGHPLAQGLSLLPAGRVGEFRSWGLGICCSFALHALPLIFTNCPPLVWEGLLLGEAVPQIASFSRVIPSFLGFHVAVTQAD